MAGARPSPLGPGPGRGPGRGGARTTLLPPGEGRRRWSRGGRSVGTGRRQSVGGVRGGSYPADALLPVALPGAPAPLPLEEVPDAGGSHAAVLALISVGTLPESMNTAGLPAIWA